MNDVEIYYFSGTGNSLHVAKELQKRIPEANLMPIVRVLKKDRIKTNGEIVGFVFPLHGLTIPIPVNKFLNKVDLVSTKYLFAVVTRGGGPCRAFIKMEKMLKKQGKHLDAYFILNMANNDPKFKTYDVPTEDLIAKLESAVQVRLDSIQEIVLNRETHREKDTTPYHLNFVLERLIPFITEHNDGGTKNYFYADSKCAGCGTCEKVCLSQKIKIINKKPVWQENVKCFHCYACLTYCPVQSVQINSKWFMKSYTKKNERYPHPWATAKEISDQK